MSYKSFDESKVIDDLIGISINARTSIPGFHHLHLELTGSCDIVYDHLAPGATTPSDVESPVLSGITVVEGKQAEVLTEPVEFRYNSEEIDGFFGYMKNLLTDPRTRLIYQVKPRLIVILDPMEGFPFRAEVSSHELKLSYLVEMITSRRDLYNWLFKSDSFGRRLTVYLTPVERQIEKAPERIHKQDIPTDPSFRQDLRDLGMKMQAETAQEMGANLPRPQRTPEPAPAQETADPLEANRLNKFLDDVERSVNESAGADIPTVPMYPDEAGPTELEKQMIDAKSRASMESIRAQNESYLRAMHDAQLKAENSVIPGIPPSGAFRPTSTEPSGADTPSEQATEGDTTETSSNDEMPEEEASTTVRNLFGDVDTDDQK